MTMTGAWNHRNSSYYGSLPAAMNIDNSNHDERRTLMGHSHFQDAHDDSSTTTPKPNDTKGGKRLIAFLVVLTMLSVTSSTVFMLVFIAQSAQSSDYYNINNNLGDLLTNGAKWLFQTRSAQQVADEAREAMNNGLLLLEEEEHNNNVGAGSSSSTSNGNTNLLAAAFDNALLLNLHQDNKDSKNRNLHEGCEASVVIVRHCEKEHIREHCAYIGYERSVYLATLFGDDHERWPAPSYIFALAPGGRNNAQKMNFREIETAGPLAEKTGVKVNYAYDEEDTKLLAKHVQGLLHSGDLCGKVAFIAWKHSRIGHLAHLLGCGPLEHCPIDYKGSTFDPAWTIQFSYRRLLHSQHKGLIRHKHDNRPEWHVAGNVQYENFDPLAFSKQSGDYPRGGRSRGATWEDRAEMIPERKKSSKTGKLVLGHGGLENLEYMGVGPPASYNDDIDKNDDDAGK
jgi:hypothetical protein